MIYVAKRDFRYKRKEKRKMKLKKTTASLLTMTLLFTFVSAYLPQIATAQPIEVIWLTHWTEPAEITYWDTVIDQYEYETGYTVDIMMDRVEFDALYQTIMMRHAAGEDPDIMHQHAMWIPTFATWRVPPSTSIIAVPDNATVQENVRANWTAAAVAGSTYKSIVWGYPSEFNSWALVYNRYLFTQRIAELTLEGKTENATLLTNVLAKLDDLTPPLSPLSYTELTDAASLLTKWEWDATLGSYVITQTGFTPFVEGMYEEQRFQFLSMLFSNGGQYLNLVTRQALFDSTAGYQVMQLYRNLGYVIDTNTTAPGLQTVYDPLNLPGYWYEAWADETLAMIILPTWMTGVRGGMGERFSHLGIAPIPVGPSGSASKSMTYNWVNTVSQRAVDKGDGTAEAAWDFLEWINTPKDAGYITALGRPIGDQVSIMGDYLIYDSILPTRISDVDNGEVSPGVLLTDDFWFSNFSKFAKPPYGVGEVSLLGGQEVQYEVGQMFEGITILNAPVGTTVDIAAANIENILPIPGDITLNYDVAIADAVILIIDWDARPWDPVTIPPTPPWTRGRSDIDDDTIVDIDDAVILGTNY